MKMLQSGLLVAAGMAVMLVIQVAPGRARVVPVAAAQQITPMPTPLPPNVNVTNEPIVNAKQAGPWKVQLEGPVAPGEGTVHLTAPAFLEAGARYAFFWAPGDKPDQETVINVGPDGWVLVSGTANQAGAAWINVTRAIRIERMGQ